MACQGSNDSSSEGQDKDDPTEVAVTYPTTGSIERMSSKIDALIPKDAKLEILAEGFEWSEGPLWLEDQQMVIFSDIPNNRVNSWQEGDKEAKVYLQGSGYTGTTDRGGETGCNGLLLNPDGKLVLCQHGDRRMAVMDAPLSNPKPQFTTLVDNWKGKKFNSPNDAVYHANGSLYFTDPPYGLELKMEDPAKELDFQGVYRLLPDGTLRLMTDKLTRPNGIAFSPDGKTAYVAVSDPEGAIWMAYDVNEGGDFENGRVFFDVTNRVGEEKGLPDGLKIDNNGNLFATGPGGVHVFAPDGEQLGLIHTGEATANCAFNTDKSVLYITADMYLIRLKLR
jgi:gluconolactonase